MNESLASSEAVAVLYSEHHGWLQRWLRGKTGCSEQAADLAQDTFVRLIGSRQAPDELRVPRAYLTRIAHGLLVSHWRRQDVERAYLEALGHLPEPLSPSPEERHLVIETLLEVDRILDGLPPRVMQIFLLSQLDGLTYPQIAAQLGVSVNVVQKAMNRALQHCYRALYA